MEKFKYYVVYAYGTGGRGCYEASLDAPLETYDQILQLAATIATERHTDNDLVITDWKQIS